MNVEHVCQQRDTETQTKPSFELSAYGMAVVSTFSLRTRTMLVQLNEVAFGKHGLCR